MCFLLRKVVTFEPLKIHGKTTYCLDQDNIMSCTPNLFVGRCCLRMEMGKKVNNFKCFGVNLGLLRPKDTQDSDFRP
jgi:hypothetical protein